MALATQCPHCHTTFRVAADQLKLRGGIVRCGNCQRIFDGNAHLIDLDKPAAAPAPQALVGVTRQKYCVIVLSPTLTAQVVPTTVALATMLANAASVATSTR